MVMRYLCFIKTLIQVRCNYIFKYLQPFSLQNLLIKLFYFDFKPILLIYFDKFIAIKLKFKQISRMI